jgi:hypothetical protein
MVSHTAQRPVTFSIFGSTWERLDFQAGTMLVSEGAVNGRIGRCKTEDSMDDVPLDADLAQVLLD